jgi:hypothetical protein
MANGRLPTPLAGQAPEPATTVDFSKAIHPRFTMFLRWPPEYRMVALRAEHWGPTKRVTVTGRLVARARMGARREREMVYGSSTEGGYGVGVSTDHVDASHADRIDIADAELLFRGHFARSGPDLVLTGQDGHRLVVTGYFATEKHPDLVAPNGAHLNGDLVDLLAGSPAPGQYAQAQTTLPPDAIGKVEKVVGQVTLIHNGVAGPLHVGDRSTRPTLSRPVPILLAGSPSRTARRLTS